MCKQPAADARDQALDTAEPELKPVALVQLIATVTLALSTLIVAAAVTIGGLARVDVVPTMTGADAAPFATTHAPTRRAA